MERLEGGDSPRDGGGQRALVLLLLKRQMIDV